MSETMRTVRRASLVVSGVVSLIAALLLAERIIRPGVIENFGTTVLIGLLMLFLLPVATMLALRHDRRQALIAVGLERGDAVTATGEHEGLGAGSMAMHTDAHAGPDGVALHDLRAVRHGAHARAAGRTAEGGATVGHAGERLHEQGVIG